MKTQKSKAITSPSFTRLILGGSRPHTAKKLQKRPQTKQAAPIHKTPGRHIPSSSILGPPNKRFIARTESHAIFRKQTPPIQRSQQSIESSIQIKKKFPSQVQDRMGLFKEVFINHRSERLSELQQRPQPDQFVENEREKFEQGRGFYQHMIQVQPPDGLNASVAAPLTPGGGWARSIPARVNQLKKSSMKDLTIRAKAGVQAGDVQKEAHISFCLGVLNEKEGKYKESAKFYKRFFFCARLLDDPIGASLALNRLGIVYFHMKRLKKSLIFHQKHCQFTELDNKFASFYNLGICMRSLGDFEGGLSQFFKALKTAAEKQEIESECIALGQIGITLVEGKQEVRAYQYLKKCVNLAQKMKNTKIQLDCTLVLGQIATNKKDWELAYLNYEKASIIARGLKDQDSADIAACNMGISQGNFLLKRRQKEILEKLSEIK